MDKTAACAFAVGMLIAVSVSAQDHGTKPDKVSQPIPAQQPHRIRVDEDVQKAKLVHRVSPLYPPLLNGMPMNGTVVLHVIIGKNGSVKSARPVSGSPYFRDSAVKAVLQWGYEPTLVSGVAVEVDTTVSVVFEAPPDLSFNKCAKNPGHYLLFPTSTGRAHSHSNVRNRMLYPVLNEMGVAQTGFHGFRRFRATHLRKQQAPESLIKSWLGHSAQSSVTDLYDRSQADTKYRKQVAEQVGIGFEIPPIVLFVLKPSESEGAVAT